MAPWAQSSRNASLDGLRGVAVLLVLLYHHSCQNSGWVGVDLFFVLSGFLITSILRRGRDGDHYWSEFWIKRATRILPPFVLLLLATALFSFSISGTQAAIYLVSGGDILSYLRPAFEPLRPLWSLAVEEHFYFLWPFAVRLLRRYQLVWLLAGVIGLEPVLRVAGTYLRPGWEFVYFLTPFRLDGLSLGCLLALLLELPHWKEIIRRGSSAALAVTLMLLAAARFGFGDAFTRGNPTAIYNGLCYSLVALAACCGIAYVLTHGDGVVARMLSWRPLVWTGIISYGLYLYQVLIREIVTRRTGYSVRSALLIDFPITFMVAWISFRCYEQPLIGAGRQFVNVLIERSRDKVTV